MPKRVQWDTRYSSGSEAVDDRYRSILARCNAMADCLDQGGIESNRIFDEMLNSLLAHALQHFAWEEAILEIGESPELDNHRCEQEEFRFLTAEIITTVNFNRAELQTFLALWWSGHFVAASDNFRTLFEQPLAAANGT
ncbi:MAG: hemerythrin family protein [Betaproteobacteria bacterium]|uniref:Hemerythrin family protein n=1 Tax=Candidatus Proximibacter danicus TaxID=2954365 RepID=A0A9D7JZI6_9PROT|nr:hemerythrin family protein [Candidatus Proximibacter danicus]MBK9446647.1 hemerythrin family protein [Betaproteobacteria bacterium]